MVRIHLFDIRGRRGKVHLYAIDIQSIDKDNNIKDQNWKVNLYNHSLIVSIQKNTDKLLHPVTEVNIYTLVTLKVEENCRNVEEHGTEDKN